MHLWQTIHLSCYLLAELKQVINPILQRNALFGHPDVFLVAMIPDERKPVSMSELGFRKKFNENPIVGFLRFPGHTWAVRR